MHKNNRKELRETAMVDDIEAPNVCVHMYPARFIAVTMYNA